MQPRSPRLEGPRCRARHERKTPSRRSRRPRGRRTMRPGAGVSPLDLAAHELVGPVVPFEGPVLLVVLEVPCRVERIERAARKDAVVQSLDLHLEGALSTQDGLDASESRATEQAREA